MMLVAGILLLVVGAVVAALAPDPGVKKLGYIVAVIGVVVIVLILLLELLEESNTGRGDELGLVTTGLLAKTGLLSR